ncbi:hypothetical protein [Oligella urethralis]|uniref:MuF-C-terminal domain-containing protein n=1 Tax=Oligella urethralis TaxID=90245 RepID=UPI000E0FB010|nr:hypothetical protein [Oligella urethralis]
MHNIEPDVLKLLPQQLNDPIAVFKSRSDEEVYVVLTELKERKLKTGQNEPVIAALRLVNNRSGIEILNIASVYGRSRSQIKTAIEEKTTLYWNKQKGRACK